MVVATTLLVPGYETAAEIGDIAAFIASIKSEIPYAILGFSPGFIKIDLSAHLLHKREQLKKQHPRQV